MGIIMPNYLRGVRGELLAKACRVHKCASDAAPPATQQDPCSQSQSSSPDSEQWLGRNGWSHAHRPPSETSLDVFHTSGVNRIRYFEF